MENERTMRTLSGFPRILFSTLTLALPVLCIVFTLDFFSKMGIQIYSEQYYGAFLGIALAASFLIKPASAKCDKTKVAWYDWIFAAMSLAIALYVVIRYPEISLWFGKITPDRVIFGTICVLLVIEALRRWTGWVIIAVIAVFVVYSRVAPFMPGALCGLHIDMSDMMNYLFLDASGMLSMVKICAKISMAFLIFGQVLLIFDGADLMNDVVVALLGGFRGGAAKAAVIGSSLAGTVSGSPVTNVVLTGTITIPLMKKSGYTPEQAGAVEATASSGGMIMPPVMGSAAFIMADYLGISYLDVTKAALLPALLFYICLFFQVDLIAARDGIRGLPAEDRPNKFKSLKEGWVVFLAIAILVFMLVGIDYSATRAGILAAFVAIPVLCIRKSARKDFLKKLYGVFAKSGEDTLQLVIIMAGAGIIVGIIGATGLAFSLTYALVAVGKHSLLLLLILAALVCIILGMGMPAAAAYVLMAALVAPAITQLGVHPLAAHLFIFYFSIMSNITPPVAMACFVAAPIAKANPTKIGFTAVPFAAVAFLVPFMFAYSPQLILVGSAADIAVSAVTAAFGAFMLSTGIRGYYKIKLPPLGRIACFAAGVFLLLPATLNGGVSLSLAFNIAGMILAAAMTAAAGAMEKKQNAQILENEEPT